MCIRDRCWVCLAPGVLELGHSFTTRDSSSRHVVSGNPIGQAKSFIELSYDLKLFLSNYSIPLSFHRCHTYIKSETLFLLPPLLYICCMSNLILVSSSQRTPVHLHTILFPYPLDSSLSSFPPLLHEPLTLLAPPLDQLFSSWYLWDLAQSCGFQYNLCVIDNQICISSSDLSSDFYI